jgi:hypothetical protein
MDYDPQTLDQARSLIRFWMRQTDPRFPSRIPSNAALSALVDLETAQRLYDELIADLERKLGEKIPPRVAPVCHDHTQ